MREIAYWLALSLSLGVVVMLIVSCQTAGDGMSRDEAIALVHLDHQLRRAP